jgi:hypothetical protein
MYWRWVQHPRVDQVEGLAWVLLDCQVSTVDHRAAAGRKFCPERINYRSPRLLIGSRPVSRHSEVAAQHTLGAAFLAGGHS